MEARRRWGTAVVVVAAVVAGVGGAAYLVKESQTDTDEAQGDGGPLPDASADARTGKKKPGKKGQRSGGGGKPRGGGGIARGTGPAGAAPAAGAAAAASEGTDDEPDDNAPAAPRPFTGRGPAGPTYEAAIASNKQEIAIGTKDTPDLTDAQLAGPMRNGAFVGECGAPDAMKVTVKVAIKAGRPAGVSVFTSPSDPDVAGCVDRYVRTFSWPASSKMDSFTTTY